MTLFETRYDNIFKDAKWLQPLSDPPGGKPLCRDEDLEDMAFFLSDVFTTGRARNLFVFGKPGTGKTVCVKYLLSEVRRYAEKKGVSLTAVYANAGKTRTPYYTMLEIVKGLGVNVPNQGWQMFRLKQAFENVANSMSVVVAIDEVEILLLKEREPLIYYLNRQPNTTLILVSNKIEDVAAELPDQALSTLQPKLIRLEPYTLEEAETILNQRVRKALRTGVLSNSLLPSVSKIASKAEDMRLGFSIILLAGRLAENAGKEAIGSEELNEAAKSESKPKRIKDLIEERRRLEKKLKERRRRR
ncbi:MAG: AAA family ATPase [Candidatus Bathyarchaeota archaeon]|nr:AAA family ATPase [Candidatus Bathyarchaeota archaeon]